MGLKLAVAVASEAISADNHVELRLNEVLHTTSLEFTWALSKYLLV